MSPTHQEPDALLATFEQLPKTERSVLQLLSVFMEGVNRTSLVQYAREVGIQDTKGRPLSAMTVSSVMTTLDAQGLLGINPNLSYQFQCHESIQWAVTLSAVEEGCFDAMAQAARKFLPAVSEYGSFRLRGNAIISFARCMREIRNGLFGHDPKILAQHLTLGHTQFPHQLALDPPFVRLCAMPFRPTWFRTLPLAIQLLALEEIVPALLADLQEMSTIISLLQAYQHLPEEEGGARFRNLMVQILILQGKLAEAQAMLDADTPIADPHALQGWLCFMRGDNAQALEMYETALRIGQKTTRDKTFYFNGLSGLFFVLALLKSKSPANYQRIDTLLAWVRQHNILVAIPAYHGLEALMLAQRHEIAQGLAQLDASFLPKEMRSAQQHGMHTRHNREKTTRIGRLLTAIIRFWIDADRAKAKLPALHTLFSWAKSKGHLWAAMEVAALLARLKKGNDAYTTYVSRIQEHSGLCSILPIIGQGERWERALNALILLTMDKEGDTTKQRQRQTAPERRLVWLIEIRDTVCDIHPKEQTMNRGGRWTKGRVIAPKRLFDQGADLNFLTDHDWRIVRTIGRENASYGSIRYQFDWEQAMLAMVGHPRVFWHHASHVNVEVVQAEPELLVQKKNGQLNVRFATPLTQQGVIVHQESPTRCRLIEVTPTHKAMSSILGETGLQVPAEGKKQVLEAMHALSAQVTIQSAIGGGQEERETWPADTRPHLQLLPFGEGLKIKLLVRPFSERGPYLMPGRGEKTIMTDIDGKRVQTHRNLGEEYTRALAIVSACPSLAGSEGIQGEWCFEDPDLCLELLLALQTCTIDLKMEWPEGENLRVCPPVSMEHLKVQIKRENDWFALEGTIQLNESLMVKMETLLACVQEGNTRFVPLGEGQFMALTERFRKQLIEIAAFSSKSAKGRHFHPLAAPVLEELTEGAKSIKVDKRWKTHVQHIRHTQDLQVALPSTLQAELRDYQQTGFHWLARLSAWGVGACLADDMGLGKTVQALALILSRAEEGPVLVVAPVSVCLNWLREIERFAPTLNGLFFAGPQRQKQLDALKPFDVLVCSYGLLQQEGEMLAAVSWNVVILDEAQAIKNRGTKRSKAAMALNSAFKMILTGTPIENHLGELWNLFQFINPGLLGSVESFNARFAAPIERHDTKDARKRLKKLIRPFILRRTKSQVLEELPARTESVLQVEMSEEETAFYETLRRQALEQLDTLQGPPEQQRLQIFAQLMRLRRACCNSRLIVPDSPIVSTKLELFWDVVKNLLETRHKVLVFSQFVDHLAIIRERLDREKVDYQYLDGRTPAKERQRRVDAFQAGDGDLFLISLRAGGMGINLTAADYVIHMDPWWNPAVEDQASDRAHRIGQRRPVTIYRMVTQGTIEEMIVDLHRHKRNLADGLLEGSDRSGLWTAEDLLQIIRGQIRT